MPLHLRPAVGRTRLLVAAATAGTMLLTVPSANAALGAVGPVDPATGFPAWVEDASATRLDLCLDSPYCLGTAAEMKAEEGEAFWWQSESTMATSGGSALLVLAVEATYDGVAGSESAFSRVRVRADLAKAGTYKVIHPYGTKTYNVSAPGGRAINDTLDVGCLAAPGVETCAEGTPKRFDLLARGPLTNYLKWDPNTLPAAPTGFLGDANTPHRVVGTGPVASTVFRIEGPDIGGPGVHFVETDLMTVQGRLASAPTVPPPTDTAAPAVPTGLTATTQSSTAIQLSWGAVSASDLAGYRVYRDGASVAAYTTPAGTTAVLDQGLPPASTHSYRVTSYDTSGNESALSTAAQATTASAAGTPLSAVSPTTLRFNDPGTRSITVSSRGTAPLQLSGLARSGDASFRISGGTCAPTTSLSPGSSCTVAVTFSPTSRRRVLGTLTVTSNAGTDAVALVGRR